MNRTFLPFVLILALTASCAAQEVQQDARDAPPVADQPDVAPAETPATADKSADDSELTEEEVMYRVFAAEMLGNEGDLDGAVGEYLEAAMESDDPAIAMRATRVAFAAQAWQQASMAADRWALLDPENLAARESAALAMLSTADYAGAELQLEQILRLSPDKEKAWILVSQLLGRSASPDKAAKVLDNLLAGEGDESSAIGVYVQSQLAVRSGDLDRAFALAQSAVELAPRRIEFLAWAGRLALNQDDMQTGIDYIRRAWELEPGDHDMTLAYADLLARDGQEEAARELMREMEQTPDVMLSRILFEMNANDIEAANALYEDFASMEFAEPHNEPGEKAFYQAQSAEALDRPSEAIALYRTVREGKWTIPAVSRSAELMAKQGNIEGARNALAELRMQPDQIVVEESWLTEARILQQAGDNEAAMATLQQALEQFSTSIPLRYSHALIAAQMGRVDLAERDLRYILVEQPDNAAALNALGYTLADLTDRYAEAEELIRRAYALQPDDASVTDSMGWVAFRLGRLEEAEDYLRRAWALDKNPEIAAHLGEVLWVQGKQEAARAVWQDGLASGGDNPVLLDTIDRLDPAL